MRERDERGSASGGPPAERGRAHRVRVAPPDGGLWTAAAVTGRYSSTFAAMWGSDSPVISLPEQFFRAAAAHPGRTAVSTADDEVTYGGLAGTALRWRPGCAPPGWAAATPSASACRATRGWSPPCSASSPRAPRTCRSTTATSRAAPTAPSPTPVPGSWSTPRPGTRSWRRSPCRRRWASGRTTWPTCCSPAAPPARRRAWPSSTAPSPPMLGWAQEAFDRGRGPPSRRRWRPSASTSRCSSCCCRSAAAAPSCWPTTCSRSPSTPGSASSPCSTRCRPPRPSCSTTPLPPSVRTVAFGGERLSRALADRAYANPGVTRVVNLYGPTENTVVATAAEVPAGEREQPVIGTAVGGTRTHVVGADGRPADEGELWLTGTQLARGYVGRPDLTAAAFVELEGERAYRTGDQVRLVDGVLHYVGRDDDQVKVRGVRIELGEVEAALSELVGARRVAAAVVGDRLVGYVDGDLDTGAARGALRDLLPEFLVPDQLVTTELVLGSTGKIDRSALPRPSEREGGRRRCSPRPRRGAGRRPGARPARPGRPRPRGAPRRRRAALARGGAAGAATGRAGRTAAGPRVRARGRHRGGRRARARDGAEGGCRPPCHRPPVPARSCRSPTCSGGCGCCARWPTTRPSPRWGCTCASTRRRPPRCCGPRWCA